MPLISLETGKCARRMPEAVQTASQLKDLVSAVGEVDVMIAPPFTARAGASAVKGGAIIHIDFSHCKIRSFS